MAFTEWLHDEARDVFRRDGTHAQILFLFADAGLTSVTPIPPNTTQQQVTEGVRGAVREHGLYGVVLVAEVWTYFPKGPTDHTVFQIHDGEMNVSDLREGDRKEALMVRAESRDGDCLTWMDGIVRDGKLARLGRSMSLPKEACLNLKGYFT
jgi:hypothetical protein